MFETLPIISRLAEEQQKAVTALAKVDKLAKGAVLARQGQAGEEIFALLEGEVSIELINPKGGTSPIKVLQKGELFGEMVLLGRKRRVATVRANSSVTIATWPVPQLLQLFEKQPLVGYRFMLALACDLADRLEGSNTVLRQVAG